MKKFILFVAIGTAMILGCSSCKNAKMYCWEYTWVREEGRTSTGYMWDTQDYLEFFSAYVKKYDGAVFTFEKTSKYKTAEDCLDAHRMVNR